MKCLRGDFLLSPIFLSALVVLLLNDLYLKINHPGFLSGILSDVAGVIFFPILLVGIAEIGAGILPSRPYARVSWFVTATVVVCALFIIMKYTDIGEEAFILSVEWLRDSAGAGLWYSQRGLVSDPLDLLALFFAPIPMVFGRKVRGPDPKSRSKLSTRDFPK